MKKSVVLVVLILGISASQAGATGWRKDSAELAILNQHIKGKVMDYTANHGKDNRIWSRSLGQRRDVYVYLPPLYDPHQRYPLIIFLHGFAQDEQFFLKMVPVMDRAMCKGELPQAIVVAPDGSLPGEPCPTEPGSFFLNTQAGPFEDFVLQDVWDFICRTYPIRSERAAHVLAGVSMGGFAAYNLGIRHRQVFGTVIGIFPPLNLRWVDDRDNYMANFDPRHWGWRIRLDRPDEIIAKFVSGLVKLRVRQFVEPLYGLGDGALEEIAANNPIELVDRTGLRNGELNMYVGYGGKDEFNLDAQVESFLFLAKCRGLAVGVGYVPEGRHDMATAAQLYPGLIQWLAPKIAPYSPRPCSTGCVP